MNFGSAYVFNDADESDIYEVVSDEEFMAGMDLSDSDSDEGYADVTERPGATLQQRSNSAASGTGQKLSSEADLAPPPPPPPPPELNMISQAKTLSAEDESKPPLLGRMSQFLSDSTTNKSLAVSDSPCQPVRPGDLGPPRLLPASCQRSHKTKSDRMHHWKSDHTNGSIPIISKEAQKQGKRRVFRRADTNMVSIRFDTLKTPSAMHAGEVIMCSDCEAIMSHISRIEDDGPDKIWKCEFCGNCNLVEIEEEEKPTADDVTYLVEPALSTSACGTSGRDESIVIFCIDTSGSMTITTEVPGHQKLRGSETLRRLRRENTTEGPQRLPSESRNVTHVSRLQAVQAAVDHQLGEMAREFPDRRIGLVTFSYEVKVTGDGTGEEVTVSGQKLMDKEELTKVGTELPCPKPIKETRASLGDKIFGLEEGGSTALGPALIVALSMASQRPGSKVIVCTDGKSNEGVGKVENLREADPDPGEFYESVAAAANSKGVSISVITISGTDCKLIHLGKLADSTGGQVNIVDPLKLTEEFSNVLADRIIATSVVATFILHRGLYIGKEENEASKERREIGNVRSDHEISFEYGVRRRKSKEKPKPNPLHRISEVSTSLEDNPPHSIRGSDKLSEKGSSSTPAETLPEAGAASEGGSTADVGGGGDGSDLPSELPFQLQITYTDIDGMKALRVLTQKKPVTNDRNVAEKDADLSVLGVHTERKASMLALQGDYTGSRAVALMNQRLGWRSSCCSEDLHSRRKLYHRAFSGVKEVENRVQAQQRQEIYTHGRTHSDDEDDDCDEKYLVVSADLSPTHNTNRNRGSSVPEVPRLKRLHKKKVRSEEIDDSMAQELYESCASSTLHVGRKWQPRKK